MERQERYGREEGSSMSASKMRVSHDVPVITGILDNPEKYSSEISTHAHWIDQKYRLGALAFARADDPGAPLESMMTGVDIEARNTFDRWMLGIVSEVIETVHHGSTFTGHSEKVRAETYGIETMIKRLCEVAASFEADTGELLPMDMLFDIIDVDIPTLLRDLALSDETR